MINQMWTDQSVVTIGGRGLTRCGSAIEWMALIKAGYAVQSTLRPIKNTTPSISLTMLVPELGMWIARVRSEVAAYNLKEKEIVQYVNSHAEYFQRIRVVA